MYVQEARDQLEKHRTDVQETREKYAENVIHAAENEDVVHISIDAADMAKTRFPQNIFAKWLR